MPTTRRSFLQTLGIAATGIAFMPRGSWIVPDQIEAYDGPPNLHWLLAESVALLAAELPAKQFRYIATPSRLGANGGRDQFGIHMRWEESMWQRTRQEIRAMWLQPAMAQLANHIAYLKPKTCLRLDVPDRTEQAAVISAPKHGLSLRYLRAWDMGHSWTDEETGKGALHRPAGSLASTCLLPKMADTLTLTIRLHDPKEKRDPELSACWAVIQVPREDLELGLADFLEKHVTPHLPKLKQLKLKV